MKENKWDKIAYPTPIACFQRVFEYFQSPAPELTVNTRFWPFWSLGLASNLFRAFSIFRTRPHQTQVICNCFEPLSPIFGLFLSFLVLFNCFQLFFLTILKFYYIYKPVHNCFHNIPPIFDAYHSILPVFNHIIHF